MAADLTEVEKQIEAASIETRTHRVYFRGDYVGRLDSEARGDDGARAGCAEGVGRPVHIASIQP